ncbi:MAG: PDZ domain-containing protein [Balneolaceae bacterium]|nr:PDZ domain-containing protein [Balneolaceae bacterium]
MPTPRNAGLLGIDWAVENGTYRIRIQSFVEPNGIMKFAPPSAMPGVDVNEGDYILAVNGVPLDTEEDPYAAFQGLAEQTVELTVNDKPTMEGARNVLVETLDAGDETRLRHLAWIESNRHDELNGSHRRACWLHLRAEHRCGRAE